MKFSPQSQYLYRILLKEKQSLSARELASRMYIFPNTVYRLAAELQDMGLIRETGRYSSQFVAKPASEGLSLFLLSQTNWFSKKFLAKEYGKGEKIPETEEVEFSFVQSRDELMRLSAEEINKATKSVDLLRSGHEIPSDVMLATIEAKKRGIITRMLIQDFNKENAQQVAYWKKNGILVRKSPLVHIRLMIYDAKTVYFMSYKHKDSEKDLGMKINYPPLAAIFFKLFEDWWKRAGKI